MGRWMRRNGNTSQQAPKRRGHQNTNEPLLSRWREAFRPVARNYWTSPSIFRTGKYRSRIVYERGLFRMTCGTI
jgi:hypothetical protein